MAKITTCNFRCKNCEHRFSVKVHGSDSNCPKKGDQLRDCPKCGSKNVTITGAGNISVLCIVISAIIGLVGGLLYLFLQNLSFDF